MPKAILSFIAILLFGCSNQSHHCDSDILNLEAPHFPLNPTALQQYIADNGYQPITDSIQLLRYLDTGKDGIFFRDLGDSNRSKYSINIKDGLVKTATYQLDVILITDSTSTDFWLRTYDQNRKRISGFHFAGYHSRDSFYYSGRIDCDTLIHQEIFNINKKAIYKIDKNGKIILVKETKAEE